MVLHISQAFDGIVYAPPAEMREGVLYAGPDKLLQWLEAQLGLSGYSANTEYLRIELYRQSLAQCLREGVFYENSFSADRFATAEALLAWRDELLMAGWDFSSDQTTPPRLSALAEVEAVFQKKIQDPQFGILAVGVADRFAHVIECLTERRAPVSEIWLYEPVRLQSPVVQRVLRCLEAKGTPVRNKETVAAADPDTRLGRWQAKLLQQQPSEGEIRETVPSIAVIKSRRDSDAAVFLAQAMRQAPDWRPVFLLPEMDLLLEQCLVNEGFPNMGVLSASLARPSLQALKLAPAFLWEPVDVFKVMEFLTLPLKPFDTGLAIEIARVLAEKPGLYSDTWYAAALGYLEAHEDRAEARAQYEFWFDRRRYPMDGTAPKRDAIALYAYLQEWARQGLEDAAGNPSLLVLAEQARRIRELLEALPEQRIGYLELERIVRTIYEPSPMQLAPAASGSFAYAHQPGAIAEQAEDLVWWNCLHSGAVPMPDKWARQERAYLAERSVWPETPRTQSQRQQLLEIRPLLNTSGKLILVVPEQADGAEAIPSLLLSDLEAMFGSDMAGFTYDFKKKSDRERLSAWLRSPEPDMVEARNTPRHRPFLAVHRPERLPQAEYETPTNLESLFYYPHRWFFRQKLKFYPLRLLHVTAENTLKGNLAHRFFEKLLQQDLSALERGDVYQWVENEAQDLLPREGATLLLYGREPERLVFLKKVKNAAWVLVNAIRTNQWEVENTEMELSGEFLGTPIKGKADLVLRRGDERAIVDLKWSGATRRMEMIKNEEDLQLVMYAHLLPPEGQWPHTAYFILEDAKIIARNRAAFRDAQVAVEACDDHATVCASIFHRMEKTFAWRQEQLQGGMVELRSSRTAIELESIYEGQLFDLLEMKDEDARWDDYRTLLNL
jgi:hypothetical protein